VADAHVHQVADQPVIRLDVDREKASQMGLTQRDVTSSMLISLSGSGTVAPNFWMNWTNGINYNIGVQTPQYRIDTLDALRHRHTEIPVPHRIIRSFSRTWFRFNGRICP
jgi:multidrug efflux pump subunit AcrB